MDSYTHCERHYINIMVINEDIAKTMYVIDSKKKSKTLLIRGVRNNASIRFAQK